MPEKLTKESSNNLNNKKKKEKEKKIRETIQCVNMTLCGEAKEIRVFSMFK